MKKIITIFLLIQSILSFSQIILKPYKEFQGTNINDQTGRTLTALGDINGDGYIDFTNNIGFKTHIFYGNIENKLIAGDTIPYSYLITHGDLNNDGLEDLILSRSDINTFNVYYGKKTGIGKSPDYTYTAPENSGWLGSTMDAQGDINNDGYDDLIVGQPELDRGFSRYGKVLLFYGSATGLKSSPSIEYTNIAGTIGYGSVVKHLGDINGDGFGDFTIFALKLFLVQPLTSNFAEIYMGSSTAPIKSNRVLTLGDITTVERAGDINNDGYDDIIFSGISSLGNMDYHEIHLGTSTGLSVDKLYAINEGFRGKATGIGDFNNDGFDDIAISDPSYYHWSIKGYGKVDVLLGTSTGMPNDESFSYKAAEPGMIVGPPYDLGDYNKDGFSDFLLACPNFSKGTNTKEGKLLLFMGRTSATSSFIRNKPIICKEVSFQFINKSNTHATRFLWDFGDGTTSTEASPQHSYPEAKSYVVTMKAFDKRGFADILKDTIVVPPPLSAGNYTLGSNNANFKDIEAFNTAIQCGIYGNVNLAIDTGNFHQRIIIDSLDVFNKQGSYSLTITGQANKSNANKTIVLGANIYKSSDIGLSNIIFLDTLYEGGYLGPVVTFKKSNRIRLENSVISNTYYNEDRGITIDSCNQVAILNTYFRNSRLYSSNFNCILGSQNSNINIKGNIFNTPQWWGSTVELTKSENLNIDSNRFYGKPSVDDLMESPLTLNDVKGLIITKNIIYNSERFINLVNCQGTASQKSIYNNSFGHDTCRSIDPPFSLVQCKNLDIFHNTISTMVNNSYAVKLTGSSIRFQNNLVKSGNPSSSCLAIKDEVTGSDPGIFLDHNFYSGRLGIRNQSGLANTLEQWTQYTRMDSNSVQGAIGFESSSYLMPSYNKSIINEAAPRITEIPKDILEHDRGSLTTDMGAYEINADTSVHYHTNGNIRLVAIVNQKLSLGENFIKIRIYNRRKVQVDSMILSYQFENEPIVTEKWFGKLKALDTLEYTFKASINVPKGKVYHISSMISLGKGPIETDSSDNALSKQVYAPMQGLYHIYGPSADFASIVESNWHISRAGVALGNKVTFKVFPREVPDTLAVLTGPADYIPSDSTVWLWFGGISGGKNITIKNFKFNIEAARITNYEDITIDSCFFTSPTFYKNQEYIYSGFGEYNGLQITTPGKNVTVKNCNFKNLNTGINFNAYDSYGSLNSFKGKNQVLNCTFDSVYYGIGIYKGSSNSNDSIIIDHNKITNTEVGIFRYASDSKDASSVKISNNLILANMMIQQEISGLIIYNNKVIGKQHGLIIEFGSMYNNIVVGDIYINNTGPANVYNNTIKGSIQISSEFVSQMKFINNNCYTDSTIVISSGFGHIAENNNYYRKDGGPIAHSFTYPAIIQSIEALTDRFNTELHSFSTDPMFVSATDLHSTSPLLKGRGIPFNNLQFDIDGTPRNLVQPTIGAYEITDGDVVNTVPKLTGTSPQNNSTEVKVNTVLVFDFDRNVTVDTGKVRLWDYETDTLVQTLGRADISRLDLNSISIALKERLLGTHKYYVTLGEHLVHNTGMGNEAIEGKDFLSFTTRKIAGEVKTVSVEAVSENTVLVTGEIKAFIDTFTFTEKGICFGEIGSKKYFLTVIDHSPSLGKYALSTYLQPYQPYWTKAYCISGTDTLYGDMIIFDLKALATQDPTLSKQNLHVYPNPVVDVLNLESSISETVEILIFDQVGTVLKKTSMTGSKTIDVSILKPGIYNLQINHNGLNTYRRFTKK